MDNSQSSDVFSDSTSMLSCNDSSLIMDVSDYDSLLHNIKTSLCNSVQIKKLSFPSHFSSLLEDCRLCITQSLEFVLNILSDSNILPSKLTLYMENAVSVLQMLSGLIKNMVESISMACCSFKTFPTTTGHILMLVFTHCKNSESMYGVQLKNVQMQLKDLFRTCHELQLTYLMVLEKRFIFDLTDREQLDIIIEALDINLKIGEVVQTLDVKTMAEQWKAYTALCEKYSSHLMDKLVYQQCTQSLCCMVLNNLKTALEAHQDDKLVLRSLKVTNFAIKIMLKMCIIFKHTPLRDYSQIIEMLIFVYMNSPSYLELTEKSTQFINGMSTNVCNPIDILLMEMILDEKFVDAIINYNMEKSSNKEMLGYLLLVTSIIKSSVQRSEQILSLSKHRLIECVFKSLSHSQSCLNIGLKIKSEPREPFSFGLFEHILKYTTALSLTMNSEEMCHLERTMYEAILGVESVTALFASSLWTALASLTDNCQLLLNQMSFLCQTYQKLKCNRLFSLSPQNHHLSHTLTSLFECMRQEDKLRLLKQYNPLDTKNMPLWTVLKISSLPEDVEEKIQEEILERFKQHAQLDLITKESIDNLVNITRLTASCSLSSVDDDVEEDIVRLWMKACPKNCTFLSKTLHKGTMWYYEYIEALVSLTDAMDMFQQNSANLIKVLHVLSNIIQIGNTELNLIVLDLLCYLPSPPIGDENKHAADTLLSKSFRILLTQGCSIVKNKLLRAIKSCDNKFAEQIISSVVSENPVLQEYWDNYFRLSNKDNNIPKLMEQLHTASDFKYIHKCMEDGPKSYSNFETLDAKQKSCSSNFDFADLDTLFDTESDMEQPVSKKLKLDGGEAEALLNRIENDTSLLCTLKEHVFTSEHRRRIKDLCEKLRSFVD